MTPGCRFVAGDSCKQAQEEVVYDFAFVDYEGFGKYAPKSFADILSGFTKYKQG